MTFNTDFIWILARSTGVGSLVALTLSVLTGILVRFRTLPMARIAVPV